MGSIKTSIQYGHQRIDVECPGKVLVPKIIPKSEHPLSFTDKLANPIGCPPLRERDLRDKSIAVLTSDVTRPCPTEQLLTNLSKELERGGACDQDVMVIFGLGAHRRQTKQEQLSLLGEELSSRYEYVDSDPTKVINFGSTIRGTPIDVFEPVARADVRIALGVVGLHYFAGFSGGYKALIPGVSSKRTIQHNHAMMVDPNSRAGQLIGNPVREDLEEAASVVGLDFIVNVVLDQNHSIQDVFAGHPIKAHRTACELAGKMSEVHIESQAEIVIVGSGGFPKDINLYQAQKALDNAAHAVKDGGLIIWVAECQEGFGHPVFEKYIRSLTAGEILKSIENEFVLGGHKAAAIAKVQRRATVWLVSSFQASTVMECGMMPFDDLGEAIEAGMDHLSPDGEFLIIPDGSSVLPKLEI
jgi:nickel-dependent lactate racemase